MSRIVNLACMSALGSSLFRGVRQLSCRFPQVSAQSFAAVNRRPVFRLCTAHFSTTNNIYAFSPTLRLFQNTSDGKPPTLTLVHRNIDLTHGIQPQVHKQKKHGSLMNARITFTKLLAKTSYQWKNTTSTDPDC